MNHNNDFSNDDINNNNIVDSAKNESIAEADANAKKANSIDLNAEKGDVKNNNAAKIYAMEFDVEFPSGISAGAGSFGNRIQLARNGRDEFVLRGTAIVGVLRNAVRVLRRNDSRYIDSFFGSANGDCSDNPQTPSRLKADDAVLITSPTSERRSLERTFHQRNRARGTVVDSSLYSVESVPPKTSTTFRLLLSELETLPDDLSAETFLKEIAGLFQSGLVFGGCRARGVGRAEVRGDFRTKTYRLNDPDGYATWLDDDYARRSGEKIGGWEKLDGVSDDGETLKVVWSFVIPRGQDVLVADGKGLEADAEPQRVAGADGRDYWTLPGSSLRGILRSECARLAAREVKQTAVSAVDSAERPESPRPPFFDQSTAQPFSQSSKQTFNKASAQTPGKINAQSNDGDEKISERELDENDPIVSMFGSLRQAGRLHITDGLSPVGIDRRSLAELSVSSFPRQDSSQDSPRPSDSDSACSAIPNSVQSPFGEPVNTKSKNQISNRDSNSFAATEREAVRVPIQYRVHVAVDPFSGGAIDGALFDDYVLTSGGNPAVRFPITMILRNPRKDEVRWLARTLRRIHLGQLRVGSGKAAGRLEILSESLRAEGPFAEFFDGICSISEPDWVFRDSPRIGSPSNESSPNGATADALPAENLNAANQTPNSPLLPGQLVVKSSGGKISYRVKFINSNGKEVETSVSGTAQCFDDRDAENGTEVLVLCDTKNGQPKEIFIPGKEKKVPSRDKFAQKTRPQSPNRAVSNRSPFSNSRSGNFSRRETSRPPGDNVPQASASLLGSPFHNPYTFIPFQKEIPDRRPPTLLTADEIETDRFTGSLEIELETLSPLLVSEPRPFEEKESQNSNQTETPKRRALEIQKIGSDVVLPASGVRGFLRFLTTVVTGGPPVLCDQESYFCQGRDLPLTSPILARVLDAGNSQKSGTVEIGETILVPASDLLTLYRESDDPALSGQNRSKLPRPEPNKPEPTKLCVRCDVEGIPDKMRTGEPDAEFPSAVKLSGTPVGNKGKKKEGIFVRGLKKIELSPKFWKAYASRHRFGIRPELKNGDLIWIEPTQKDATAEEIRSEADVASLQWARWGRKGTLIAEMIPKELFPQSLIPDSNRNDGLVSQATDLFGQIPIRGAKAVAFKGRVLPDNLVFKDAATAIERNVPLAVLASPHFGCVPFYRESDGSSLRGYKVYRREIPGSETPPWLFQTQGIYDDSGRLAANDDSKITFSADLLKVGRRGTVSLALRSLSRQETGLILYLCQDVWRLGGGKPLGLGACRVVAVRLRNELGDAVDPRQFPEPKKAIQSRFELWKKTQTPVERLRYPRAVVRNSNKNSRSGLVWFQKCASPKKSTQNGELQPIYVCDELAQKANQGRRNVQNADVAEIAGQSLPNNSNNPEQEILYGYDAFFCDSCHSGDPDDLKKIERRSQTFRNQTQGCYPAIETFDESKHRTGSEKSGENLSLNAETRRQSKKERR